MACNFVPVPADDGSSRQSLIFEFPANTPPDEMQKQIMAMMKTKMERDATARKDATVAALAAARSSGQPTTEKGQRANNK